MHVAWDLPYRSRHWKRHLLWWTRYLYVLWVQVCTWPAVCGPLLESLSTSTKVMWTVGKDPPVRNQCGTIAVQCSVGMVDLG